MSVYMVLPPTSPCGVEWAAATVGGVAVVVVDDDDDDPPRPLQTMGGTVITGQGTTCACLS